MLYVLSKWSSADNKLHCCSFFSCRLTPAEKNYDIGNREPLAVKVFLEEWRHWLDGTDQPFLVWTDHKNLTYIQSAKWLNSQLARWVLFFGKFNFTLTYRPGSRNIEPNSLSHHFTTEETGSNPDPLLPHTCFIATITLEIESLVKHTQMVKYTQNQHIFTSVHSSLFMSTLLSLLSLFCLTQVTVPPVACLSLAQSAPRFSSGLIPHILPVILVSTRPSPSSVNGSGSPPWMLTPGPSSLPVPCAPETSPPWDPALAFSALCQPQASCINEPEVLANYRPISNLPFLFKILEKAVVWLSA